MRGFVVSSVITGIYLIIVVMLVVGAIIMSLFQIFAQSVSTGMITEATIQPISITSGLLQTRLLDSRTLVDEALHSLGGAVFSSTPVANIAFHDWKIERWHMRVANSVSSAEAGTAFLTRCYGANDISGICVQYSSCSVIPGAEDVPDSSDQCDGKACCKEDYDFSLAEFSTTPALAGVPTCGPDSGYYGICEPAGCSMGRKDMGQLDCPELAVGNHCCRPFTDDERTELATIQMIDITIPLLYPKLSGNLTIEMSMLKEIKNVR